MQSLTRAVKRGNAIIKYNSATKQNEVWRKSKRGFGAKSKVAYAEPIKDDQGKRIGFKGVFLPY